MIAKHDLRAKKLVKPKGVKKKKLANEIYEIYFRIKMQSLCNLLLIGAEAKNLGDISIPKISIHQARLNYTSACRCWKAKFIMLNLKTQGTSILRNNHAEKF